MANKVAFGQEAMAMAGEAVCDGEVDWRVGRLVQELIGRVADKWTMLILELLVEKGELRFTRISEQVEGISQKMLTQTLRQMERDGLVRRTVHAVVPPKVEYRLTALGMSLGGAFCGVWLWAEANLAAVEAARAAFAERVGDASRQAVQEGAADLSTAADLRSDCGSDFGREDGA